MKFWHHYKRIPLNDRITAATFGLAWVPTSEGAVECRSTGLAGDSVVTGDPVMAADSVVTGELEAGTIVVAVELVVAGELVAVVTKSFRKIVSFSITVSTCDDETPSYP